MRPCRFLVPTIALLLSAACAADADVDAGEGVDAPGDATTPGEATPPGDATAPDDAAPPADASDPDSWVVTFSGVGPLELGMTRAEAAAALGRGSVDVSGPSPACGYILPPQTPAGIAAMIVDERVVRIDVMEGETPTTAGARIGDSEARIRSLYEGRVEEEPHKYVEGSYLSVSPPGGGEARILFETQGETVTAYRTGLLPQVRWVEGCS